MAILIFYCEGVTMLDNLRHLFDKQPSDPPEILELKNKIRSLQIELDEQKLANDRLKQDLQTLADQAAHLTRQSEETWRENLIQSAATPAAHLITQARLMQSKPVAAQDILATSRRLLRIFEDLGMSAEGEPGQETAFDPQLHAPLQAGEQIAPGEPVRIRFVLIRYQGKILRKAQVDRSA